MIYPLIWMFMSSFKETGTIFETAGELWPRVWVLENYFNGWQGVSNVTFGTFFTNSAILSVGGTIGAVISSALVGYAFSRGRFVGRKILFALMLSTLMLPAQVLMVPQFLWFNQLGWIGTYMPLIVPAFFAISGFFVFLITNFMNGIPRELDEAARIDGCSFYGIFMRIILPLSVPALITTSLFSFIWRWDDFMGPLIYVRRVAQFPASLALRMFADPAAATDWGAVFAMSTLSLVPAVAIFIFLQKYLVEGISTAGLKG
ncbi:MAG: carbohydrate ABC transporter permease [Clostridiales bacterium]|jgi:multiple sugar transport system permease protein|nr:carbohydrate ABC transporter permease [Clostridiales bacterium]